MIDPWSLFCHLGFIRQSRAWALKRRWQNASNYFYDIIEGGLFSRKHLTKRVPGRVLNSKFVCSNPASYIWKKLKLKPHTDVRNRRKKQSRITRAVCTCVKSRFLRFDFFIFAKKGFPSSEMENYLITCKLSLLRLCYAEAGGRRTGQIV